MKGYSSEIPENCARARIEGVNASYKDLSEVCGRIRKKKTDWALEFLEKASEGEVPVYFARHNRNLGHRRELGGRKGRYPEKAAGIVLKALRSAIANGRTMGMGEIYEIIAASANKKQTFPRMAPKGRQARSFLETSRVEIVLKGSEVPKGVSVTPPKKKEEPKKEEKKAAAGKEEKKEPTTALKDEGKASHEHKHELEKAQDAEKKREEAPHQHGEHNKR
ncbi:MAG TPA: uL22 family ribosomal protein [Candidatus Bilamarchaeum sp.]|nr:uL22 family ribosomal protein [Candidatus Bilamarchaeum sp.]